MSYLSYYGDIKLESIDLDSSEYALVPFILPELTLLEFKNIILDFEGFNRYKYFYIFNYKGEHICDSRFNLDVLNSLEEDELNDILAKKLESLINLSKANFKNISWFPWFPLIPYTIFYIHISDKDIFHNKTD